MQYDNNSRQDQTTPKMFAPRLDIFRFPKWRPVGVQRLMGVKIFIKKTKKTNKGAFIIYIEGGGYDDFEGVILFPYYD